MFSILKARRGPVGSSSASIHKFLASGGEVFGDVSWTLANKSVDPCSLPAVQGCISCHPLPRIFFLSVLLPRGEDDLRVIVYQCSLYTALESQTCSELA